MGSHSCQSAARGKTGANRTGWLITGAVALFTFAWWFVDGVALGGRTVGFVCDLAPASLPAPLSGLCGRRADSDPRRLLVADMGLAWDEDNFWKAVARGDDRAVSLFLQGGMGVDAARLHALLDDRTATRRASLDLLSEHGASLGAEFCSSDDASEPSGATAQPHRSVLRFADYARSEIALRFVRKFCAGTDIPTRLADRLRQEDRRLEAAQAANAKLAEAERACVGKVSAAFRYKSGVKFAALNTAVIDARTCADDAFSDGLLRGYCEVNLTAMNEKCPMRSSCTVGQITAAAYCAGRFGSKPADERQKNALEAALSAYR